MNIKLDKQLKPIETIAIVGMCIIGVVAILVTIGVLFNITSTLFYTVIFGLIFASFAFTLLFGVCILVKIVKGKL